MNNEFPPPPSGTKSTKEELDRIFLGNRPKLTSRVRVVDYDPEWPRLYERERSRITDVLGEAVMALDHVGSTSVVGLAAKPIIDIDLSVADSNDEDSYLPMLEATGYRLVIREPEWERHRAFKGPDTNVNLHVWTIGGDEPARHILFRDWLRDNEADRQLYDATKREVATHDWEYISEYNAAKEPVILDIYARIYAARNADSGHIDERG